MTFYWDDSAKAELRRIRQEDAIRILRSLHRYAASGHGDVRELRGPLGGQLRLRVGDYRVLFEQLGEDFVVHRVSHRFDVYR